MIVLFWDVFGREYPVARVESAQWEGICIQVKKYTGLMCSRDLCLRGNFIVRE